MNEKRLYVGTIVSDCVLIASSAFGTTAAACGFLFMVNAGRLTDAPYFVTFTALSNLFAGLVAILCLIFRLAKKERALPIWLFLTKVSSVSMVMVTMLTTACYLVPSAGAEWWRLYINSNLFNHLITPLLALTGFMIFGKRVEVKFPYIFFTAIPLVIYGIFYLARALPHQGPNGEVDLYYDIYGLMRLGVGVTIGFLGVFILLALGIAIGLYFWNRSRKYPTSA